jgi:hypothetical protein
MKPSEFDAGKHTITVAENNRYLLLYFRWQNTPDLQGFELAIFGGVFCYTSAATRATSPAAIDLNRAQCPHNFFWWSAGERWRQKWLR